MNSRFFPKELSILNLVFEKRSSETKLALKELPLLSRGRLSPRRVFDLFWSELDTSKKDFSRSYRSKFWEFYLQAGLIKDCTIAFTHEAVLLLDKKVRPLAYQYSHLKKDKHSRGGEALLLMEFEKMIVAEWRFNGKCHLWKKNNPHKACLHQESYERKYLCKFSDRVQQHYFSKEGRWQKDLMLWIKSVVDEN